MKSVKTKNFEIFSSPKAYLSHFKTFQKINRTFKFIKYKLPKSIFKIKFLAFFYGDVPNENESYSSFSF